MLNAKEAQAVFKVSPMPQIVLKSNIPDYTIVDVNEAYLKVTGAQSEDLIGKSFFKAFQSAGESSDEEGEKVMKAAFEQVVTHKEARILEAQKYDIPEWGTDRVVKKYWIPQSYPVFNEDGEVIFILHSPVDVTEQIQKEEELQKEILIREGIQKQLLREKNYADYLIDSMPGLFYLFDEEGKLYEWNNNVEELTGYTANEIRQMHPLMFISEEDVETVRKVIEKAFIQGKAEVEAHLLLKDGTEIPFYFEGRTITLDGKNYIIGTGLDISELVKERTMRINFSQIIEKSRNEIYITDEKEMRFIYVNQGARENLGYSDEELKNMSPFDVIAEQDLDNVEEYVKPLRDQTQDMTVFNTIHCRADGSLYDVEVYLQVMQQNDQRVFVAIALDISERLKAESLVKASLREKEVLLTEIHHRVKNNLAIITSLLHLQAQTTLDSEVKAIIADIESRVQSMALIHELLYEQDDFSNIEFGTYINKLLQQISSNYRNRDTVITTEVNTDPVFFKIDSAIPCALLIHELITNCYKHAFTGRSSGKISITLNSLNNSISIKVSDNGIGLPTHIISSTLGLTLIQGLATQLKGTIVSETENGTTFTLSFPVDSSRIKLADYPVQKG